MAALSSVFGLVVVVLWRVVDGSATWTRLARDSFDAPDGRQSTIMEVVGDAAYIYGGVGDGDHNIYDDTWKFDLVHRVWLPIVTTDNPGLRFDHVSAVRTSTREVFIYGGMSLNISALNQVLGWTYDDGYIQQGDVWVLDTVAETWTEVVALADDSGNWPSARSEATAVTVGDAAMVVFGGVVIPTNLSITPVDLNDLWRLDFTTKQWTALKTSPGSAKPAARFSHSATTIPLGNVEHMVVLSGRHILQDRWSILDDAWMIPLPASQEDAKATLAWIPLRANPAYDRIYSGVVYAHQGLWMVGGVNYIEVDNAVAYPDTIYAATDTLPALDLKFDYVSDASTLTARFNHRMAIYKSNILVYGGKFRDCYGDLWMRNTTVLPAESSPYISSDRNAMNPLLFLLLAFIVLFITCIFLIAYLYKRLYQHQGVRHAVSDVVRPRGLSQEDINHFELVKFAPVPAADVADEMCPICLVEYVPDQDLRQLPCNHRFHPACIDEWLHKNQTCPMCKRDMAFPMHAQPRSDLPRPRTPGVLVDDALLND
ncbi:hypothetical protein H310_04914 [Aphanomyces invadans]|uniref:RING-type domain-containing protein n=1 Tax=Aphanomyces invadans TaxID=157072 RepID=A0A024UAN3_9STRA|nr:hypothetical protein H310_04914 [Aphanomyces invadans]ETW03456.1 hypothetical protein H310_04914 [Aphanomyces invadans]|eukprot:XP_008867685.1 hypothetical protein H310_04914 [Aphanomyces invadans]